MTYPSDDTPERAAELAKMWRRRWAKHQDRCPRCRDGWQCVEGADLEAQSQEEAARAARR